MVFFRNVATCGLNETKSHVLDHLDTVAKLGRVLFKLYSQACDKCAQTTNQRTVPGGGHQSTAMLVFKMLTSSILKFSCWSVFTQILWPQKLQDVKYLEYSSLFSLANRGKVNLWISIWSSHFCSFTQFLNTGVHHPCIPTTHTYPSPGYLPPLNPYKPKSGSQRDFI